MDGSGVDLRLISTAAIAFWGACPGVLCASCCSASLSLQKSEALLCLLLGFIGGSDSYSPFGVSAWPKVSIAKL